MKSSPTCRGKRAWHLAVLTATALAAAPVLAQGTWPSRPIRMVVPSPGGSGPDVLARVFAEQISQALKQPVVVDNKPGANGQLSVGAVVRAQPDVHTLANVRQWSLSRDVFVVGRARRLGAFLHAGVASYGALDGPADAFVALHVPAGGGSDGGG